MPLGIRFGLFHGCSASPYIRRQFLSTGLQKPSLERSFGHYLGRPGNLWGRLGGNMSLLSYFKPLAEQLVGWQEPVLEGLEGALGRGRRASLGSRKPFLERPGDILEASEAILGRLDASNEGQT